MRISAFEVMPVRVFSQGRHAALARLAAGSVLASVLVAAPAGWYIHRSAGEEQAAADSLVLALPLLQKMGRGTPVSDHEILHAQVGLMEPLLRVQAASQRALTVASAAFAAAHAASQPERILAPAALASPRIRQESRERLQQWDVAARMYQSRVMAIIDQQRREVRLALQQMSSDFLNLANGGVERAANEFGAHVQSQLAISRQSMRAIGGILDLLDSRPDAYELDSALNERLRFKDSAVFEQFRVQLDSVLGARERLQQDEQRYRAARQSGTRHLSALDIR